MLYFLVTSLSNKFNLLLRTSRPHYKPIRVAHEHSLNSFPSPRKNAATRLLCDSIIRTQQENQQYGKGDLERRRARGERCSDALKAQRREFSDEGLRSGRRAGVEDARLGRLTTIF